MNGGPPLNGISEPIPKVSEPISRPKQQPTDQGKGGKKWVIKLKKYSIIANIIEKNIQLLRFAIFFKFSKNTVLKTVLNPEIPLILF